MRALNVSEMKLTLEDPAAARTRCEGGRVEMLDDDVESITEMRRSLLPPVEAAALTDERADQRFDSVMLGVARGADG
jgi:hypothetical protein